MLFQICYEPQEGLTKAKIICIVLLLFKSGNKVC